MVVSTDDASFQETTRTETFAKSYNNNTQHTSQHVQPPQTFLPQQDNWHPYNPNQEDGYILNNDLGMGDNQNYDVDDNLSFSASNADNTIVSPHCHTTGGHVKHPVAQSNGLSHQRNRIGPFGDQEDDGQTNDIHYVNRTVDDNSLGGVDYGINPHNGDEFNDFDTDQKNLQFSEQDDLFGSQSHDGNDLFDEFERNHEDDDGLVFSHNPRGDAEVGYGQGPLFNFTRQDDADGGDALGHSELNFDEYNNNDNDHGGQFARFVGEEESNFFNDTPNFEDLGETQNGTGDIFDDEPQINGNMANFQIGFNDAFPQLFSTLEPQQGQVSDTFFSRQMESTLEYQQFHAQKDRVAIDVPFLQPEEDNTVNNTPEAFLCSTNPDDVPPLEADSNLFGIHGDENNLNLPDFEEFEDQIVGSPYLFNSGPQSRRSLENADVQAEFMDAVEPLDSHSVSPQNAGCEKDVPENRDSLPNEIREILQQEIEFIQNAADEREAALSRRMEQLEKDLEKEQTLRCQMLEIQNTLQQEKEYEIMTMKKALLSQKEQQLEELKNASMRDKSELSGRYKDDIQQLKERIADLQREHELDLQQCERQRRELVEQCSQLESQVQKLSIVSNSSVVPTSAPSKKDFTSQWNSLAVGVISRSEYDALVQTHFKEMEIMKAKYESAVKRSSSNSPVTEDDFKEFQRRHPRELALFARSLEKQLEQKLHSNSEEIAQITEKYKREKDELILQQKDYLSERLTSEITALKQQHQQKLVDIAHRIKDQCTRVYEEALRALKTEFVSREQQNIQKFVEEREAYRRETLQWRLGPNNRENPDLLSTIQNLQKLLEERDQQMEQLKQTTNDTMSEMKQKCLTTISKMKETFSKASTVASETPSTVKDSTKLSTNTNKGSSAPAAKKPASAASSVKGRSVSFTGKAASRSALAPSARANMTSTLSSINLTHGKQQSGRVGGNGTTVSAAMTAPSISRKTSAASSARSTTSVSHATRDHTRQGSNGP